MVDWWCWWEDWLNQMLETNESDWHRYFVSGIMSIYKLCSNIKPRMCKKILYDIPWYKCSISFFFFLSKCRVSKKLLEYGNTKFNTSILPFFGKNIGVTSLAHLKQFSAINTSQISTKRYSLVKLKCKVFTVIVHSNLRKYILKR